MESITNSHIDHRCRDGRECYCSPSTWELKNTLFNKIMELKSKRVKYLVGWRY